MARTTAALVQGILTKFNYHCKIDLTPYIDTASNLVDDVIECASNQSPALTITGTKAELLERWLAAHFYMVFDLGYKEKMTGKSSAKFQGETKMGLSATLAGQQALVLDTSGCLRSFDTVRPKASLIWLGKTKTEQIDYDDRN